MATYEYASGHTPGKRNPNESWAWSGNEVGSGTYIGGGDYNPDGSVKAAPVAATTTPNPTPGPSFKFGSGSFTGDQLNAFYNNAMGAGKSEGDYANFIADQASQFGATADEVAKVGQYYNPNGGYNAGSVDKWIDTTKPQYDVGKDGVIGSAQYDFGAGNKTTTVGGTTIRDGYLKRLQDGETNAGIGTQVLEQAVLNGGNVTQIAAGLRSINPNITPDQIAQFIAQNNLDYVVNADGTISRKTKTTATGATGGTVVTNSSGTNVDASGTPTLGFNLSNVQNAEKWTIDPKTQTVAGQLEQILKSDNPLMIQARTRALQQQEASGRLNSTMAASAADSAMYDAALQIATPDAATYAENARYNTGEANTFARDANGFLRDGVMADFNVRANDWAADQNQGRTLARDATLQGYNLQNKALDADIQGKRDATLQAYGLTNKATDAEITAKRDQILNDYTVGAAVTASTVQAARDALLNGYTVARDAQGHLYNLAEIAAQPIRAEIDNSGRDRSWQLEDRSYEVGVNADNTARSRMVDLRNNFNTNYVNLVSGDLEGPAKDAAITALRDNYNQTVTLIADSRGFSTAGWTVNLEKTTPADESTPGKTGGNVVEKLDVRG